MQLQAYQGYYENGCIHVDGRKIRLPVRRKMTVVFEVNSVQENETTEQEINKRLEIVKSLRGIIPANFELEAVREERLAR